jgi:hypothetical protein
MVFTGEGWPEAEIVRQRENWFFNGGDADLDMI